jgi:Fe-S-cluster containining protein
MIRCLSIHAPYVCAHAGECCRAGWTIPIEEPLVAPLRVVGFDVGRVAPTRANGECAFFEADEGRLCTIHRRGGPALLPSVCRHFPRVIVNDPRGASVTLSHFCPTAASLLFTGAPLSLVDAPRPISLDGSLEGLDATNVLPPLLSKDVLTDWDGYTAWEEAAVELFNVEGIGPEQAVAALARATERLTAWRPGAEELSSRVRKEFCAALKEIRPGDERWGEYARPVKAFLAAHAFASWAAYDRDGLVSVVAAVESALRQLARRLNASAPAITAASLTDAIRCADLQLRHGPSN